MLHATVRLVDIAPNTALEALRHKTRIYLITLEPITITELLTIR